MNARPLAALAVILMVLAAGQARAQCAGWTAGPFDAGSVPEGVTGTVFASVLWDPDGAGPLPALLVVAGDFTSVGGVAAANIAARDPLTGRWQALGGGTNGQIRALAVFGGQLIAGGSFTSADGQPFTSYIARWDGTAWQALGTGTGNLVYALTVWNNVLVAGGYFINAGGVSAAHVAQWDGNAWSAIGVGIDDWVVSLGQYNGELVAGGYFANAGGAPAHRIAAWNGSAWHALGAGTDQEVLALGVFNGTLLAGGRFLSAGGVAASHVAAWDGAAWHALGAGTDQPVLAFTVYLGALVAGGAFSLAGGGPAAGVATWNGAAWSGLGHGTGGTVASLLLFDNDLVAGGQFASVDLRPAHSLARWNGFEWGTFGGGAAAGVFAFANFAGRLVAGGDFHQSTLDDAAPAHFVAGWDGASLAAYGTGMDNPVFALLAFKYPGIRGANELVAGGSFTHAGGVAANFVARWDQAFLAFPPPAWAAMGAGFSGPVYALERFNGATHAGGAFVASGATPASRVARWNDTTSQWEALGSGMNGPVYALRAYGGYLYAGGGFTSAGGVSTGGLARWDGATWSAVGGFFNGVVYALEVHGGLLAIGGLYPGIGGSPNLAVYDGAGYSTLGVGGTNGAVRALHSTGTRLYAGGDFTLAGGAGVSRVAYWDGAWHDVAGGVSDRVWALGGFGGEVDAGGTFATAGAAATPSPTWARSTSSGLPWFVAAPFALTAQVGDVVTFTSTPASGYDPLAFQWFRSGAPLADGPTGSGSTLSGTHGPSLTIANVTHFDYDTYQLVMSDACGADSSAAVTLTPGGTTAVPGALTLATAFESLGPNPSHGPCALGFALAREGAVRVRVHDLAGRRVRALDLGRRPAGRHAAAWDGRDADGAPVRAGMYFVVVEVDGRAIGGKRLLVLP